MIGSLLSTLTSLVGSFVPVLTFLSTISTSVSETQFFDKLIGMPMGTNSAPLLADLFLHTFEYDYMLTTMEQDMTKGVSFGNTFRYIDDLFSGDNDSFEEYISSIYPSELESKDTTMASNEVCYLDTRIKQEDDSTPYHISMYEKRDDVDFRIVNFPHIDSNIPANPAYGIYISQLVRYARICTCKADFLQSRHVFIGKVSNLHF